MHRPSTADPPVDEGQQLAARDGIAIVTGGTGGIGSAICRLFASRASDVAFTYLFAGDAAAALKDELRQYGARVFAGRVDGRDRDAVGRFVAQVADAGVHTVVHASGPPVPQRYVSSLTAQDVTTHVLTEASAFANLVDATLPHLRASAGSLLAVTTAALRRHAPRDALSTTSKAGIEAMVRAIAVEEGRYGVRANCVAPGMLTDGMAAQLRTTGDLDENALNAALRNIPMRHFGTALDVAEAVCFLASPRATYITGQTIAVDGGYSTA